MSKLDISTEVREVHSRNTLSILVTFEVLKFDKSKEVKDEHLLNICSILVTLEVSKCDRSKEVRDEQPENIYTIDVTSDVSRYFKPEIETNLLQSMNQYQVSNGFIFEKLISKTTCVNLLDTVDFHAGVY